MAEIQNSFFYDGNQQYGESELGIVFDTCFRSGVRVDDNDTLCYKVTAGTGNVVVDPGEALVGGRWRYDASSQTLATTAPATYNRLDRVVIRTDYANKKTEIVIKQGAEASSPTAPDLQRDSSLYEISLATIQVTLQNAVTVISDDRTSDKLCGVVRPRYNTQLNQMISDFESYIADVKSSFAAWFAQQQSSKGWRQIFIQDDEPGSAEATAGALWFDTSAGNMGLVLRVADATGKFTGNYTFYNSTDLILDYQVHEKDNDWTGVKENGEVAGTVHQARRIEAIRVGYHKKFNLAPEHQEEKSAYNAYDHPLHQISSDGR